MVFVEFCTWMLKPSLKTFRKIVNSSHHVLTIDNIQVTFYDIGHSPLLAYNDIMRSVQFKMCRSCNISICFTCGVKKSTHFIYDNYVFANHRYFACVRDIKCLMDSFITQSKLWIIHYFNAFRHSDLSSLFIFTL